MKAKLRARVVIEQEYEADSLDYGNAEFVSDMISIDVKNFNDDPIMFICGMLESGCDIKISIKRIGAKNKA
jgi:hypothetical protein